MKEIIKKYVKENKSVSFADLNHYFEENNIEYEGSKCVYFNKDMNWIVWGNMSKDYMEAILELEKEKIIDFIPCHKFAYMIDGLIPNLPIVMGATKYKNPHWIPCTLN